MLLDVIQITFDNCNVSCRSKPISQITIRTIKVYMAPGAPSAHGGSFIYGDRKHLMPKKYIFFGSPKGGFNNGVGVNFRVGTTLSGC